MIPSLSQKIKTVEESLIEGIDSNYELMKMIEDKFLFYEIKNFELNKDGTGFATLVLHLKTEGALTIGVHITIDGEVPISTINALIVAVKNI